jgi:hypothetical protein
MLYVSPLSRQEVRPLRHLVRTADSEVARRAQIILWSGQGISVPMIALRLVCCRRNVRRWIHRYQAEGWKGLLPPTPPPPSRPSFWERHRGSALYPAVREPEGPKPRARVRLSVPELRRLFTSWQRLRPPPWGFTLAWSDFRRAHQATAMQCHYRARGCSPPRFA